MKKIFTLCLGLVAALAVQAQSDFPAQFADKDGNIIADGTELSLDQAKIVDYGGGITEIMILSNVFVKNTTDSQVQVGANYNIKTLENGAFQTCFPNSCTQKRATGRFTTESGPLAANVLKDMETEWLPASEGTCVVEYQLVTYKQNPITKEWTEDKQGPKITMNFTYSTAAVNSTKADKEVSSVEYYDLQGRHIGNGTKGLYVKKTFFADGTSIQQKMMRR